MEEVINLIIGVLVLISGVPLGIYLAKVTEEELRDGQKWFRLIVFVSLFIGCLGLIARNDFILFSGFFVAIVTSRSVRRKKKLRK